MTYEEAVEQVQSEFPFEDTRKYMKSVGWKWGGGEDSRVPSVADMKQTVRLMLENMTDNAVGISTGGFTIRLTAKKKSCTVSLGFGKELLDDEESEMKFWVEAPYTP